MWTMPHAKPQPATNSQEKTSGFPHYPHVLSIHTRRLPHYTCTDHPVFLTWRLRGSLPKGFVIPGQTCAEADRELDRATTGPLHVRKPEIAAIIAAAIRHRNNSDYQLHKNNARATHGPNSIQTLL